MNSRVSWSVEGIDPSVRERAEAAARRAGMSLSDWLNSTIGDPAPPNFRAKPDSCLIRCRIACPISGRPCRPRKPRTSPTFTSGWIRSPARSNGFRVRCPPPMRPEATCCATIRRAAMRRVMIPASPGSSMTRFRGWMRGCRRSRTQHPRNNPNMTTGSARPIWSSAPPPKSISLAGLSPVAAAQPGLVRQRDRGNLGAPARTR